jgi:hypothetical protein
MIAGDLEGIVSDHADDAVLITPDGVRHGRDGVREGFVKLLGDLPQPEWEVPDPDLPRPAERWCVRELGVDSRVRREALEPLRRVSRDAKHPLRRCGGTVAP